MRLPEIKLDDRTHDDFVADARRRIHELCPEWTEHNVSDPGITLIELFAYMTDVTVYRLNRVPDQLHRALLELLGIRLDPPEAARAELRFRLVEAAREPIPIPAQTEVSTPRTGREEPVVFCVDEAFTVPAARPRAYLVQRGGHVQDVRVADGLARPQGSERLPFDRPPATGDALLLGFEAPLGRLLLAVDVDASPARGAGVDPRRPPLAWEVSQPDGGWAPAEVLEDHTGGFNFGSGRVELQAPPESGPHEIRGRELHWLRCSVTQGGEGPGRYTEPPEIREIGAGVIGALLPASHADVMEHDVLGTSDGTPGQRFELRHRAVLAPAEGAGEVLEVRAPREREWVPWTPVDDFAASSEDDPHYVLDLATGAVELGPAIRDRGGRWTRKGAVPPAGATLRFARYRHGGGRAGNTGAHQLSVLRTPIPGVDVVTNPEHARDGVDAETLDEARRRAHMEIRTRWRAVTQEDFEFLAEEVVGVARAHCVPPREAGGTVAVHVLPTVERDGSEEEPLSARDVVASRELLAKVAAKLDARRLVGTRLRVDSFRFKGLTVVTSVRASRLAPRDRVERDVRHALNTFINPLRGGNPTGPGDGWPFGRPLNTAELFGVVLAVQGVELVDWVRVYETDLATGVQASKWTEGRITLEPDELFASWRHMVQARHEEGGR